MNSRLRNIFYYRRTYSNQCLSAATHYLAAQLFVLFIHKFRVEVNAHHWVQHWPAELNSSSMGWCCIQRWAFINGDQCYRREEKQCFICNQRNYGCGKERLGMAIMFFFKGFGSFLYAISAISCPCSLKW